jgi:hypothetical protein
MSSSPPQRRSDGVLLDSSPLQPPQTATTVRVRNGEMQLTDGPFAEIKEQLGGYYVQRPRYGAAVRGNDPVGQIRVG